MKDGGIQEKRYAAEHLRAEVSENGKSSRFLYYNGQLLVESEPDETVTSRYILGYGVAAGGIKERGISFLSSGRAEQHSIYYRFRSESRKQLSV